MIIECFLFVLNETWKKYYLTNCGFYIQIIGHQCTDNSCEFQMYIRTFGVFQIIIKTAIFSFFQYAFEVSYSHIFMKLPLKLPSFKINYPMCYQNYQLPLKCIHQHRWNITFLFDLKYICLLESTSSSVLRFLLAFRFIT